MAPRTVTTLHGRQDLPDLQELYAAFPDVQLISISDAQRSPVPNANFVGTVHHGLPSNFCNRPSPPPEDTLRFSVRISPEKRVDRAIAVARAAGLPLKIAAKVDRVDRDYYSAKIEPLLHEPGIEYIGDIYERAKERFLGDALALIFPIDGPEPFGLVTIEAMACGTPVLAFDKGAMREIIDEGVTGVVQSVVEATTMLTRVIALDRARVRHQFQERFTARRMAIDYVQIYQQLLDCTGVQTAA